MSYNFQFLVNLWDKKYCKPKVTCDIGESWFIAESSRRTCLPIITSSIGTIVPSRAWWWAQMGANTVRSSRTDKAFGGRCIIHIGTILKKKVKYEGTSVSFFTTPPNRKWKFPSGAMVFFVATLLRYCYASSSLRIYAKCCCCCW